MKKVSLVICSLCAVVSVYGLYSCASSGGSSSDDNFVPSINFALPTSVTSETNASQVSADESIGSNCYEFNHWAYRTHMIVAHINHIIEKLSVLGVSGTGDFTFTFTKSGTEKTVRGTIKELAGDPDYNYEAIICVDGAIFNYLKWNTAKTKLYSYRDHSVDIILNNEKNIKSEVVYDKGTSQDSLSLYAYGTPWNVPNDVENDTTNGGTYLSEYAYATKDTTNVFTVKGVRAWEVAARTSATASDPFTGDAYFTGKINADNSALSVVYRVFNSMCGTFSESTPDWCFAVNVGTDGLASLSTNTTSNWTTLEPIGVAPAASLKVVTAPDKVCP